MGILFFIIDFLMFLTALALAIFIRQQQLNPQFFFENLLPFLPIFLTTSFTLWIFEFYDTAKLRKNGINLVYLATALVLSLGIAVGLLYFIFPFFDFLTPKTILVLVLAIYFAYIYLSRRFYSKAELQKQRIIIFGESPTIDSIIEEIKELKTYTIVEHSPFPDPDKNYDIDNLDFVIISSRLFSKHACAWPAVADKFIAKGICLDTDFNFYERLFKRIPRESVDDGMWVMRGIGTYREKGIYDEVKRMGDFTLAFIMLPLLAPLGALIYLLIAAVDRHDPIFSQKRVGLMGRHIKLYKFRTITPSTQESDKEKITALGAFLRRFRLDEIPQIINVLNGTLSFVGPRPIWVGEWPILDKQIPNHSIRVVVKPGITGWAQINFKAPPNYFIAKEAQSFDGGFKRFSYDVWYIKNRSLILDLEIVVRTGLRIFIKG